MFSLTRVQDTWGEFGYWFGVEGREEKIDRSNGWKKVWLMTENGDGWVTGYLMERMVQFTFDGLDFVVRNIRFNKRVLSYKYASKGIKGWK